VGWSYTLNLFLACVFCCSNQGGLLAARCVVYICSRQVLLSQSHDGGCCIAVCIWGPLGAQSVTSPITSHFFWRDNASQDALHIHHSCVLSSQCARSNAKQGGGAAGVPWAHLWCGMHMSMCLVALVLCCVCPKPWAGCRDGCWIRHWWRGRPCTAHAWIPLHIAVC
jgi:hypothetical protein